MTEVCKQSTHSTGVDEDAKGAVIRSTTLCPLASSDATAMEGGFVCPLKAAGIVPTVTKDVLEGATVQDAQRFMDFAARSNGKKITQLCGQKGGPRPARRSN